MNFCDSCEHWEFVYDNGMEKMGTCDNITLDGMLAITDESEPVDPTLYTASVFGCIYHHKKGKNLAVAEIKINKE